MRYDYVYARDKGCRLRSILTKDEEAELKANAPPFLLNLLDPAHVVRRSASQKLKDDMRNVVILNRFSHQALDNYCNPVNNKRIGKEETNKWWIRIIGQSLFDQLQKEK